MRERLGPFDFGMMAEAYGPAVKATLTITDSCVTYYEGYEHYSHLYRRNGRYMQIDKESLFEGWVIDNKENGKGRMILNQGSYYIG